MIFFDMDGVLVDFVTAAYSAHGRTRREGEPDSFDFFQSWGMTDDEFWAPINAMGPEFWSTIPPYEWVDELVGPLRKLEGFHIATANSRHPNSAAGKVIAIKSLFGERFRDYVITPRKWLLGAPGRLLVDDNEENCEKFSALGGSSILFPQPWNSNRGLCPERLNYVNQKIAKFRWGDA